MAHHNAELATSVVLIGWFDPETDSSGLENRYPDHECQFLLPSLTEYLGSNAVVEVWNPYRESRTERFARLLRILKDSSTTHIVTIDVKAIGFGFFAFFLSFLIGINSRIHKVVLSSDLLSATGIVLAWLQSGKHGVIFAGTHPKELGVRLFGRYAPFYGSVDWSKLYHPNELRITEKDVTYEERSIDVLGPGNQYSTRANLISLIDAGIQPDFKVLYPDKGTTPYPTYMSLLRDSKITLCPSLVRPDVLMRNSFLVHGDEYKRHVNARAFEAMAMGSCVLVQDCKALPEVLGPATLCYITFRDAEDAIQKIRYLLSPEGILLARSIALNGRRWALKKVRERVFWNRVDMALTDNGLHTLCKRQNQMQS
jgi:hypothetical protein